MLQSDNPHHLRSFIPCLKIRYKIPSLSLHNSTMAAAQRRSGLKHLIRKLQNHLQQSRRVEALPGFVCEERVPHDVKEGQFAVVAKKDEEKPTRFVVELSVLKHPQFLRLLELAEDEFGFQHDGALELPCQPEELRRILQDRNSSTSSHSF
ncbi:protein SMALL AUXIN UP-REGULATED RNA 10-like [Salvia miltiorrhiza]|uniref:protein SMALL AUXIN UP-REGULATED RNA 10-like n=1 Tax=Salvia miltiorrhiza TaxID=226208 RepID=UPI0025AD1166|nr:protein SMALL AUXIN UP-REGULATED RNA 10-like [Salvia miltiorrhiza]